MNVSSSVRLACAGLATLALLGTTPVTPRASASDFRLPPLISSKMVLQRGRTSTFWGTGTPGTSVRLEPGWSHRTLTTTVRADSSWRLTFSPPAGPGPYTIRLAAADTVVLLSDVLVGEVWLCSGQSNMEMPLEGWPPDSPVAGSDSAIAAANQPTMRLFTVTRNMSATSGSAFTGAWVECSPATARTFSATGFFFGRALHDALHVPVGLVHSSWGGTPVEAWMSHGALAAFPEFREPLARLAQDEDSLAALDRWLHRHPAIAIDEAVPGRRWEDVTLADDACARPGLDDRAWRTIAVPGDWEDRGVGAFDGIAWYRRQVTIPRAWIGQALTLRLGPIDDMDRTYVNGTLVGGMMGLGHWRTPRAYTVPAALVRDTVLQLAVRVVDIIGGGGLWGNGQPIDLFAADSTAAISLAGAWKLQPVAEFFPPVLYDYGAPNSDFGSRPRLPIEFNPGTPTVLYNGMIAPLASFSIRGAVWYQGEANVPDAARYRRLFPAMIADWRRTFGAHDLPFYFVQIAPYAYDPGTNSQLLREAQLQTMSVPHTGMAVALDAESPHNIHPSHKREIGERLAAWALARTYGRRVPCSGPLYRSLKREPWCIVLNFDAVEGGLVLRPGPDGSGFQVAGADGRFVAAEAQVRGRTLVVSSAQVAAPSAVRYAFTDTSSATLFNAAGLPAPSFRTDAAAAPR